MNLSEIRDLAYKLANTYSADGQLIPLSDNADARLAMTDFINTGYYKSLQFTPVEAVYSITQKSIPNLLNMYSSFNLVQHLDTDYTVTATSAKSYYFEVDKDCVVYIEEIISGVWTTLSTITVTGITSFTEYKGLITASNVANDIRIRFSGNYPYNIRRTALYYYSFASANDVPKFKPYVNYPLPGDYISLNKIVVNGDDREHSTLIDYGIEKKNLVLNYFYSGSFDVHYFKRPDPLVLDTDIPETPIEGHSYLAYFSSGSWLFSTGQQAQGLTLINQYDSFMTESTPTIDEQNGTIENFNNW